MAVFAGQDAACCDCAPERKGMICFQNAGKFILKNIELYIPKGVAVGVIGASGAGKTTLLKLVSGLLESDVGIVRTMGKNPARERRLLSTCLRAYFAEHFYFQEEETPRCQFHLMEVLYPGDRKMFWEEYKMLERQFCFSEYVDKPVKHLSLGQRRRVELAAVLLGEAGLYLFDEAVNGMDEQGKHVFWKQLQRKKESGATILISSHNMEEIRQVCDRIILLDQGRVLYYGDRDGLIRRFAPIGQIEIQFEGRLPDMEDIPLVWYHIQQDLLRLAYNTNHISAAEIIQRILGQTHIVRMNVMKQNLSDVIAAASAERRNDE
ncbi:ABC transporter ATP-binding protein [bacterium D16-51]|nr:ABC transporter ATP-binding protein [bacterium D16-59]RKI57030.1 ABC transporter ATP-binding protein [bacterium D16-51]